MLGVFVYVRTVGLFDDVGYVPAPLLQYSRLYGIGLKLRIYLYIWQTYSCALVKPLTIELIYQCHHLSGELLNEFIGRKCLNSFFLLERPYWNVTYTFWHRAA